MNYAALTGAKPGFARGRDFVSLSLCYFRVVKLVAPQDAAEQIRCYMAANLVLNTKKGITIKMGVGRVIKMNDVLPYLPC